MFESMKVKTLNTLLSSPAVLGFVNKKVDRYGLVDRLFVDESGYHAEVSLLGRGAALTIDARSIRFSEDGARVSLHGMKASELWLQHLLEDFLEGREFALPEAAVTALKPFRSMLPQGE